MTRRETLLPSVALTFAALMTGCGGGGNSGSGTTPPPAVTISISPTSSDVAFGGTQQFTATVSGTSNTAVAWSVSAPNISPVTGGNAQLGTITSAGLYTAPHPAKLSNPFPSPPSSFSVVAGGANCDFSQPASCAGGSIIAAGTLSLTPQIPSTTVTVTAVSQADSTKSASATVTIASLSLFAVGTCPSATPGATCAAGSTGVEVNAGASPILFVVGEGVVSGTTFSISNPPSVPDVTIVGTVQYCTTRGTPAYPCATFQIAVLPSAQTGPRNIMVSDPAGELAAFPGGLQICPATGCTP